VEWLADYAMFLAKAATVLLALVVLLVLVVSLKDRHRRSDGTLTVNKINEQISRMSDRLAQSVLDKKAFKLLQKGRKLEAKRRGKNEDERPRVFVLGFDGDIKASAVDHLRHEITAVRARARTEDEIVQKLESGGGMVHSYGLAASQLVRIREAGIPLTVCVDKVAASGGYMMACIGNRVLAAPFAMLGSIGVVAQLPNFNKVLKKHDVEYEMLTAGEYKRTLTMFGENTEKGREKFREDLENIHRLFKGFVARYRPQLNVDEVATGEVWFGIEAEHRALTDGIQTSDEYITGRVREADVFEVHYVTRKRMQDKLAGGLTGMVDRLLLLWASRFHNQKFW
jgi:serine protease SohB